MIITEKNNYINGTAVLAPNVHPREDEEKKEKVSIDRKALKEERDKKLKGKLKIMRNIALIFVVGVAVVGRYSQIYTMQRQLNTLNREISNINKDNESLKLELAKYNNLKFIENIATTKLKMIRPTKADVMYVDMSKEVIKK
ncbi:hypothetical protein GCM10008905_17270 [Clostridium malenominatum]|uniref:Cell division protein FtsL n=1 Tax=Clostridium malenominatum TaxID=1539 RepID=A0ABN1IYH1_9CLOT